MLKAVIVDDESKAIQSLSWELSNFEDEIEVVKTFNCPDEALTYISNNKFDCLFLDVEMPTMDGFQFLEKIPKKDFQVIFTTAYDEYAIKAMKNDALDYLLKPVDTDDLKKTIEKIKKYQKISADYDNNEKIEEVLLSFHQRFNQRKITINADGKLIFLDSSEIVFIESDGNYSSIFLITGKKIVVTKKLKEVNEILPKNYFFRIHNSYIVNLDKIKEFYKTDGYVILEGNHKIPVSRQKKSEFLNKL